MSPIIAIFARISHLPWQKLWSPLAFLLSIVVTAALILAARYAPELGYDEAASILGLSILDGHFGNPPDPIGPIGFQRHFVMDCYPPVYYLVQAALFGMFGFDIVVARAASALFVGATALLCFHGGRMAAGPAAGFVAMATYLVIPLKIYTLVARPDVAAPFFVLAAIVVLHGDIGGRSTRRMRFLLAGLLYALAVLSHFVALMAGPVLAVLLWAQSGARFWRTARFYAFLLGFFAPVAAYLALIHPHYMSTMQHFVNYTNVGAAGAASSVWARWPLRPLLSHIEVLRLYYPWVLYGLLPASVALAALGARSHVWRQRMTQAGWLLCIGFIGLWLMVGVYPNIAVYSYYGPIYLTLGAVVAGILLGAMLPAGWGRHAAIVAICALPAMVMTGQLAKKVRDIVRTSVNNPITAPLTWTAEFPLLRETRVLATPHWVFSSAGERVRSTGILRASNGDLTLSERYMQAVPDSGRLADYGAAIFDKWNEFHVLQRLARTGVAGRPATSLAAHQAFGEFAALATQSYRISGLYSDSQWITSDFAILSRTARTDSAGPERNWPRMATSTATGPQELSVDDACSISIDGAALPVAQHWSSLLGTQVLRLEAGPGMENMLLAVRIVTAPVTASGSAGARDGAAGRAVGYAAYYPDRERVAAARRALQANQAPNIEPGTSFGLLGFRLANGEIGREMLVRPGATGSGGLLALNLIETSAILRIDLAPALAAQQPCTPELRKALAAMRDRALAAAES